MAYARLQNREGIKEFDLDELKTSGIPKERTIGRNPGNHIQTVHLGSSNKHCTITYNGRNFVLIDRGSTNGTWLVKRRGMPVREERIARDLPFVLHHGDELELGRPDQGGHADRLRFYDGPIDIGPEQSAAFDNPHPELILGALDRTDIRNLREVIDAILEISRTLATRFKVEEMGKDLMEQLPRVFPKGQRFLLFGTIPNTRYLRLLARKSHGRRRFLSGDDDDPTYSKTIYRQVVDERNAVIYSDSGNQDLAESIMDMGIKSIMCVPVESPDGTVLGMLQIDADQNARFAKEDLETLKVIAQQVGAAMQMAELHRVALTQVQQQQEMKHAAEIVKLILPHNLPQVPSFEFYADYQPCEAVGGDFYHFTPIDSDRMALGVCDVVGHGVSAALIMMMLSSELRNAFRQQLDPAQTLELLDAVLTPTLSPPDTFMCRFVPMSLAILNTRDGTMTLTNGGHPKLIVRRADGRLDFPDKDLSGRAVGLDYGDESIKDENFFETGKTRLNPGDVAVYYSDGVIDADDIHGKPFGGLESLRQFGEIIANTQGGPKAVGEAVMKRLQEFTAGAPVKDDITLLCFGPTAAFQPVG
jgi:serine phosphatase RsbU (regulator of sigma subunit)